MNAHLLRPSARLQRLSVLVGGLLALPLVAAESWAPSIVTVDKVSANVRLRYEQSAQSGVPDAEALTAALRFGFASDPAKNWQWAVEADRAMVLTSDDNTSLRTIGGAPGFPGTSYKPFHQSTEEESEFRLSQAWLAFRQGNTLTTLGRQRLAFDNERFIGPDDWRLAPRVFDALAVHHEFTEKLSLTYAYIWRVSGPSAAPDIWDGAVGPVRSTPPRIDEDSDSHLLHVRYSGWAAGTLSGYAYLLDLGDDPYRRWQSCATYGLSFAGSRALTSSLRLDYRAEAALQTDYGDYAGDYSTDYQAIKVGLGWKACTLSLGGEWRDHDGSGGFQTPWGSQSLFGGWAGAVPDRTGNGMRDLSVEFAADLPAKIRLEAAYHGFQPIRHKGYVYPAVWPNFHFNYGQAHEFDLQATRPFGRFLTGGIKYADFQSDAIFRRPNVRRLWVQAQFTY